MWGVKKRLQIQIKEIEVERHKLQVEIRLLKVLI